MSRAIGKKEWAVSAGWVPFATKGVEPAMTSRDELRLLNTGSRKAHIEIFVMYANEQIGRPYTVTVGARRLRRVRINDLIDPIPVPLEVEYGLLVRSDRRIVVQFTKVDTGNAARAMMGTTAFGD